MKQKRLFLVLAALMCLQVSSTWAQDIPEPTAQWNFNNADDLMAPDKGSLKMVPAITGTKSITLSTLSDAGIVQTEGPSDDNMAIFIPKASALKVERAEGAETTSNYTLMWDMKVPDAVTYDCLYQTNEANNNDGDLFIHNHQIGMGAMGGYFGNIRNDTWYRIVLSNSGGTVRVFINGEQLLSCPSQGRWEIDPWGFYLYCDEDGEQSDTYVSSVAFWETPLTDEQVVALGGFELPELPPFEISTAEDLAAFAEHVNSGNWDANAVLKADITLEDNVLPKIGNSEANKYGGVFDGQYHTITFNVETTEARTALFPHMAGTVKNLHTAGRISSNNSYACGIVAIMYGCTIENCVSSVEINNLSPGMDCCHSGVAGRATGGGNVIRNCVFDGKLTGEGPKSTSGFVGWAPNGTLLDGCLQIATVEMGVGGDGCFTMGWGTGLSFSNCYYLNAFGSVNDGITKITEEDLASGKICYLMNGSQENIYWTQNLGEDANPIPWPTRKQVYAQAGNFLCSGEFDPQHMPTFSNENTNPATRDPHSFNNDGVCTKCGFLDVTAVPKLVDGFYEISNATQWKWFAAQVADGRADINGRLIKDLKLDGSTLTMIGTEAHPYSGIFDGQFYTLSFDVEATEARTSPFRHLSGTVRNLHTAGRISSGYAYACGIAAIMYGCTIENCISSVEILNTVASQDFCHSGVAGRATGGGNIIRNCIFDGKLAGETPQSTSCFVGWAPTPTLVENCLQVAEFEMGTGRGTFNIGWDSGSNLTIRNCYYKNAFGSLNNGCQQVTEEQLASGEICLALNNGQERINWTQNLGEDEIPVNNTTRSAVYLIFESIINDKPESIKSAIATETDFCENMLVNKEMKEEYISAVKDLAQYNNISDMLAAYNSLLPRRQALLSCSDAYNAYKNKVDETIAYMEEHTTMTGAQTELLLDYLNSDEEPCDRFANGTAPYILDNCLLTEEEIKAETALIDEMLLKAILNSPTAGTEVTMLLENADLRNGFNGWDGQTGSATQATENMVGAEVYARTMDMYQTLTGIENGVYELQVNGAYRPNEDFTGTNYAAFLYANGIHNYFQADIEDLIPESQAEDGVNCNISGNTPDYYVEADGETVPESGYIMHGPLGCCYAFQAGRYKNSVLVNVTDNTLTVGIKKLSTRSDSKDWLGFGNIRVIYRGTVDEAGEAMDHVLADMSARANVLVNVYKWSTNTDYPLCPNFSQALKDELKACMEATATTNDKYALIEKFSDLFQQVYDCKNAYIELADYLENLFELQEYYPSYTEEIDAMNNNTWAEWDQGAYTAEEALAKKKEIEAWIKSNFGDLIPEPDLLDVVFNEDGTATDRSALGNEIIVYGEPSVVMDSDVKMNIFDASTNSWGEKPQNTYFFDMSGDLWDKLSDGFSVEALVCPTWDGNNFPSKWCGILSSAEQGGFLFGYSSQKWLFQARINDAWSNGRGNQNIEKDKWTHLVGVWDKNLGILNMYVDGHLTGSEGASGELTMSKVKDDTKVYIGCDMNGSTSGAQPESAFQGKIAYVRLYDKAMPSVAATELYNRAVATSIDEIPAKTQTAPAGIYNLMGQRVLKAQHGIFIINGKKVLVK